MLFDLETVPNLPEALKVWPSLSNFPGTTLKASISTIVCAGWKVLGSEETHCISAWDFPEWEADVNDDRRVCEELYKVLIEADCVVTHNGRRFDWKFFQTRLRKHKMAPMPKGTLHVDTCVESKRELYVVNNRLQTLAQFLTESEKMDHEGWPLWVKVHGSIPRVRDLDAEQRMQAYCKQDVIALEALFKELRPVVRGLPNQNLFNPMKINSCPHCGSTRLRAHGKRYTATRAYRRYICEDCRAWSHTDLKDELPR